VLSDGRSTGALSAEFTERWSVGLLGKGRFTVMILAVAVAALTTPSVLAAGGTSGASPQVVCCGGGSGFWYGTDGTGPTATGTSAPYGEPTLSGPPPFGGYIGEFDTWTDWRGCTSGVALNSQDVTAADTNFSGYGYGVGTGGYWYMAGPGVDPKYDPSNPSASEAENWGAAQAQAMWNAWQSEYDNGVHRLPFRIAWMDIEQGYTNLQGQQINTNGWNGWPAPGTCDGYDSANRGIPPSIDRATFDGFWNWFANTNDIQPGAYSSPGFWSYTFGSGSSSTITGTWEWTNEGSGAVTPGPIDWAQSGGVSAQFFGGQSSASTDTHVVAWQWSESDGDYDQIYRNNLPSGY